MQSRSLQILGVCTAVVFSATGVQAGPLLVAAEQRPAPGTPGMFLRLNAPEINDLGEIGFRATLTGDGIDSSNDHGVWIWRDGLVRLVARTGDAVPGLDGAVVTRIGDWEMIAGGVVVGVEYVLDGVPGGRLLFNRADGVSTQILSGPGVVTLDGREVVSIGATIDVNDFSDVVYSANFTSQDGLTIESGVLAYTSGLTRVVYSDQDGLPTPSGFARPIDSPDIMVSRDGAIVILAELEPGTGGTVADFNDDAVWVDRGGGLELVLRGAASSAIGNVTSSDLTDGRIGVRFNQQVLAIETDNAVVGILQEGTPLSADIGTLDSYLRGSVFSAETFAAVLTTDEDTSQSLVVSQDGIRERYQTGDSDLDGVRFITSFGLPLLNKRGDVVVDISAIFDSDNGFSLGDAWIARLADQPSPLVIAKRGDTITTHGDEDLIIDRIDNRLAFRLLGTSGQSAPRVSRYAVNNQRQLVSMLNFQNGLDGIVLFDLRPPCLADVNNDGELNGLDFGAWLGAFNAGDAAADQNGDGDVNGLDFGAWLANFNAGCD